MATKPGKKVLIGMPKTKVIPQFRQFKTASKPHLIRGRLKRGNP